MPHPLCVRTGVYVAWLFLPNVAILLLLAFVIPFFVWWINASYHRLKQKHGLEQEEQGTVQWLAGGRRCVERGHERPLFWEIRESGMGCKVHTVLRLN